MLIALIIVLGLIAGSFLTAFVDRLKDGRDFLKSRSSCDGCSKALAARDLVPVFSWLFLRGRCRRCQAKISYAYPLIELMTALSFLAFYLFWPFDLAGWSWLFFAGWLAALVILLALAIYDWRWLILPNKLVYPLIILALVLLLGRQLLGYDVNWWSLLGSLLISSGLFYLVFLFSPRHMGGGDVKLGFALGLLLADWQLAFLMVFSASLLGVLFAWPFIQKARRRREKPKIPFGPFLIAASCLAFWFGQGLIDWYFSLV